MDSHTLGLLEFQRIKHELAEYCFSVHGAELVQQQAILTDAEEVRERLALAAAWRELLESGENLPAVDFPEIEGLLPRLARQGSVLEAGEISRIGRYITSSLTLKRYIAKQGHAGGLADIAGDLQDLSALSREIFRIVDRDGQLKEASIPELKSIRSSLRARKREVDRLIGGYLNNPDYRSYWQSVTPTLRDGRTVLPVKAKFRGRIKGIVHEVSASGATVFLEPLDVLEKNNDIVQQENAYRREVVRIMRRLTARISESLPGLETAVAKVSLLDSLHARARYAVLHDCHPAGYTPGEVVLHAARHPLLGRKAVPIEVRLGGDCRLLIVTGPNTGGKTVTLKTVGLLSLMNQFGMEIPAEIGSGLDVFDDLFADIGDEQSIEQSLSTFSSHILSIERVVANATRRSLVLLDELGAGTDPEEGVAIAMALLDYFIEKGPLTLTTTHHGILKNYGYTRAGVQNASMEFDSESLVPTFRMLIGVPGESHALDIATREGLNRSIIRQARQYLDEERGDVAKLIQHLTEKQRELMESERSHKRREVKLNEQKRETDLETLRLRQRETQLREHGLRDIKRFLEESRKELDGLIKEIRQGELSQAKTRKTADFLQSVRDYVDREQVELREARIGERHEFEPKSGMPVVLRRNGKKGRIVRKGRADTWIVETDKLRIQLAAQDFYPGGDETPARAVEFATAETIGEEPLLQLDLRGLRYEQALARLERQIDNAMVRGLREFYVIHGKGGGILQQGVQQFLARHSAVADYHFARPEEGGFGNTVVRLKS